MLGWRNCPRRNAEYEGFFETADEVDGGGAPVRFHSVPSKFVAEPEAKAAADVSAMMPAKADVEPYEPDPHAAAREAYTQALAEQNAGCAVAEADAPLAELPAEPVIVIVTPEQKERVAEKESSECAEGERKTPAPERPEQSTKVRKTVARPVPRTEYVPRDIDPEMQREIELLVDTIRFGTNYDAKVFAKERLARIGVPAKAELVTLVDDVDPLRRIFGILALRAIEAEVPLATARANIDEPYNVYALMLSLLDDPNPKIRFHAALSLRKITGAHVPFRHDAPGPQRAAGRDRWAAKLVELGLIPQR